MEHRIHRIFAQAGLSLHPDAQKLAREQLASEMPVVAAITIALNHAHADPDNDLTRFFSTPNLIDGPQSVALSQDHALLDNHPYSAVFRFRADEKGFEVRAENFTPRKMDETLFRVHATDAGKFLIETERADGTCMRRETVKNTDIALGQFSMWLTRNVDAKALRAAQAAMPKVLASKAGPGAGWRMPFAHVA